METPERVKKGVGVWSLQNLPMTASVRTYSLEASRFLKFQGGTLYGTI